MSQITIQNLSFTYEGDYVPVFQGLDLRLDTGWKLGLVGRNGRGKTTLLRLLEGTLAGQGTVACPEPCLYAPEPVADPSKTLRRLLLSGAAEEWRLVRELSKLGLGEEMLERPFSSLSGGEQTRALLAALFLNEGCYPMLDEPTNHLDSAGRALTAGYLRGLNRGFLLVSHDRAFLDGCVDHVLALNRTGPELVRGNFSTWLGEKEARDRGELAQNEKLKGEIRRLEQAARRTAGWSEEAEKRKYGAKNSGLRVDRGFVGHKAAKVMKRAKTIQTRQEDALREKSALLKDLEQAPPLKLFPLPHRGGPVLEMKDVSISYGDRKVCQGVGFTVEPGQRVCLDGGNGSGKTSLLRLALGEELCHTGTVRRTAQLEVSYVSQQAGHLSGDLKRWAREQGLDVTLLLSVLRSLDFPRALFERDMGEYSAGQKKKVLLGASLCSQAHLYVWDEPLNYIDLFSRIQIERLVLEYRPTLLFVEHDRAFRDKIATQVVRL